MAAFSSVIGLAVHRAVAEPKIKTDPIDAVRLTQLHVSGVLPEVWMSGGATSKNELTHGERSWNLRAPRPTREGRYGRSSRASVPAGRWE